MINLVLLIIALVVIIPIGLVGFIYALFKKDRSYYFITIHIAYLITCSRTIVRGQIWRQTRGKDSAMALLWFFMLAAFLGILIGQWQSVFTYLFLSIALFDAAFGYLFRGSIFYLGNNWTDKIQKKFPHWVRITIWATSFTLAILTNYKL
jgi:hypothetical protein